ncbi:TatD family hydrolase [Daejeonella oryzae]|uniref:TatD family hydrolase n=1 Tax=Daejeonella oryzae TaxID=1122943 RepID=UPI0004077ABF|nr:TatD family hydrolase [Daejeonella oryzae]
MILTDTHTHLYYETDTQKLNHLIERGLENSVSRFFLPNVNVSTISLVNNLAALYPQNCFPMLGLHPCEVKAEATEEVAAYIEELQAIRKAMDLQKLYAVGEIGIDLYWDKTTLKIQQEAFLIQIKWAKELNMPIVIHCREAFDEIFEILEQEKDEKLRGIFHCFTGNLQQAKRVIGLGFYLGIGGVLTYKNSGLDKVISEIDLKDLVLETDSPYLSPVPFRGKPNESSYLIYIAQKLADLKHVSLDEVARITSDNSFKVFGI